MSQLRVALGQMTSVDDVTENLKSIKKQTAEAVAQKAEIIFFPENSLYMRVKEGEKIPGVELNDPAFNDLTEIAKKNKICIHLGSMPLKQDGKIYNSSIWITPESKPQASYQKLHLFDIELSGQKPVRESDLFASGGKPSILEFRDWKFGQTICYDLRFAELYHYYATHDVDAILVPAAFLVPTGKVHWEVLLRARAIESQTYVLAAAQVGSHQSRRDPRPEVFRETYGNSLVVDPWGEILKRGSGTVPEVLVVDLDKNRIDLVRRQIPMKNHRRPKTVYGP